MITENQSKIDDEFWWSNRPLRVYHPNMREWEAYDLNVPEFIEDCRGLGAEAIVFSTGGIYAFYHTEVDGHRMSEACEDRDLLAEIIDEAHAQDLKVIARLDFSKAPRDWFDEHPSWFHRLPGEDPDDPGSSDRGDRYYSTNVLGGYQNEAFAEPVLREIMSNYDIDGVHLNAAGWSSREFAESMIEEHDIPPEGHARQTWKEEQFADQLKRYREIIHGISDEPPVFMGETNSIDSPGWGRTRGYNPERMAAGFTNLLATAGEPSIEQRYRFRWWVALTADWLHAAGGPGLPLINLKATGGYGDKLTLKPVAEFQFSAYQAMAHNAGIKAAMYALLENHPDPRSEQMFAEPFQFMAAQEEYMTGATRLAPIGLVWPSTTLTTEGDDTIRIAEAMRDPLFGLYRSMTRRHLLCDLLMSDQIGDRIDGYETLVLPHVACLRDVDVSSVTEFVENGGTVAILDHPINGMFEPVPAALESFIDGTFSTDSIEPGYATPATSHPAADQIGPKTISQPVRTHTPPNDADQWLLDSPTPGGGYIPEEHVTFEPGEQSVAFTVDRGEGRIAYVGFGLGQLLWRDDLPTVETMLEDLVVSPGGRTISGDLPPTVDVTAYHVDGDVVLHFVNATGRTPLDTPVQLSDLSVTMSTSVTGSVMCFRPGQEAQSIPYTVHDRGLTVELPALDAYAQLVIDG